MAMRSRKVRREKDRIQSEMLSFIGPAPVKDTLIKFAKLRS